MADIFFISGISTSNNSNDFQLVYFDLIYQAQTYHWADYTPFLSGSSLTNYIESKFSSYTADICNQISISSQAICNKPDSLWNTGGKYFFYDIVNQCTTTPLALSAHSISCSTANLSSIIFADGTTLSSVLFLTSSGVPYNNAIAGLNLANNNLTANSITCSTITALGSVSTGINYQGATTAQCIYVPTSISGVSISGGAGIFASLSSYVTVSGGNFYTSNGITSNTLSSNVITLGTVTSQNIIVKNSLSSGTVSAGISRFSSITSSTISSGTGTFAGIRFTGMIGPTSSSGNGIIGDIRVDSNYLYVCTGSNAWRRIGLSSF